MKTFFRILLFLVAINVFGQKFTVYGIDASNFPKMKAQFKLLDFGGDFVNSPLLSDFVVIENGVVRKVTNVTCTYTPVPPKVSLAMSIDVSGSMASNYSEIPVELGKTTASTLCDLIKMPPNEFALQKCHDKAVLINDFSTDKNLIKSLITQIRAGGDNDFVEHLLNPNTGILNIAKAGKYKKHVVLYTDAWWYALTKKELDQCINICLTNDITFHAVIYSRKEAEPNGIKSSLRSLAVATNGGFYDGVTSEEAAKSIAESISAEVYANQNCTIEWDSDYLCKDDFINAKIKYTPYNLTQNTGYNYLESNINNLIFDPPFVCFKNKKTGYTYDTLITVKSTKKDFVVNNIITSNSNFTFDKKNILIPKDSPVTLKLSYKATDSSYSYTKFDFQTNDCNFEYYASTFYFTNKKINLDTLKLLSPNGGETFVVGTDTNIVWKGISKYDPIRIEYSYDNQKNWKTLSDSAVGYSFNWKKVPKPTSSNCFVRIKQLAGKSNGTAIDKELKYHKQAVTDLSWNNEDSQLVTSSDDGTVRIWDLNSNLGYNLPGTNDLIKNVSWSKDGSRILASNNTGTTYLFDAVAHTLIKSYSESAGDMLKNSWNPDGSCFITFSTGYLSIWNSFSGALIKKTPISANIVMGVWSPDGSKIALSDNNGQIGVYNVNNTSFTTIPGYKASNMNLSWDPFSKKLAVATKQNQAIIINSLSMTVENVLIGHSGPIKNINWSYNGNFLASASFDSTAIVWESTSGGIISKLIGHKGTVYCVKWHPSSSKLVTASGDNLAIIWDPNLGKIIRTLKGHISMVFNAEWSSTGDYIATCSGDNTARVWQVDEPVLQQDLSDNSFNIVAPNIQSSNIDLKRCLVGASKDSVVVNFVKNIGNYKCKIDSIFFTGADANAFTLTGGNPKYSLEKDESHYAEFRFKPTKIGLHNCNIVIITQSDTLTYSITGEGIKPLLSVENSFINFGKVSLGKFKDTNQVVTIKNVGTSNLTINSTKHEKPNDVDFITVSGAGPFTLAPGESQKMNLRFKPSLTGRTSGLLEFEYNGENSPAVVQLFGEGIETYPKISTNSITINELICDTENFSNVKISNTGDDDLIISKIYFTGPDSSDFKVADNLPIQIVSGKEKTVAINFKPNNPGFKNANLVLVSNANPDSILVIPISSKYQKNTIEFNSKNIDVGVIEFGISKDSSVTVTNPGTQENSFSITYSSNLASNINKLTLKSGETSVLPFKIKEILNNGDITEKITFKDTICGAEYAVLIKGTVNGIGVVFEAPQKEAYAGDTVGVALSIKGANLLKSSGTDKVNLSLIYNPTLLWPLDYTAIPCNDSYARIDLKDVSLPNFNSDLITIRFVAGLGDSAQSVLKIDNVNVGPNTKEIKIIDGKFTLLGVCTQSGKRLINPNSQAQILSVKPNPSSDEISIEYQLNEKGFAEFVLVNELGEIVKEITILDNNDYSKRIEKIRLNDLASGRYLLLLKTPTYNERINLMIIR